MWLPTTSDVEERRLFKQNSIDKRGRQASKPRNSSAIDLIVPPLSPQPGCEGERRRGGARGAGSRGTRKGFRGGASQAARPPATVADPCTLQCYTAAAIVRYISGKFLTHALPNMYLATLCQSILFQLTCMAYIKECYVV